MIARWYEKPLILYPVAAVISASFTLLAAPVKQSAGAADSFWWSVAAEAEIGSFADSGVGAALVFGVLLCINFLRLASELGADRRLAPWAALVILLFPALNRARLADPRDLAFWALLLGGLVPYLRFAAAQGWRNGLEWAAWMLAALLLRAEALIWMALLPLFHAARSRVPGLALRGAGCLQLYACLGLPALPVVLVLGRFGLLHEPLYHLIDYCAGNLQVVAIGFGRALHVFSTIVLDARTGWLAALSLCVALGVLLVLLCLRFMGLAYAALFVWGALSRRSRLPEDGAQALAGFTVAALALSCALLVRDQYLDARGLMPLCLAVLLPMPGLLRQLQAMLRPRVRPGHLAIICCVLVALLLASGLLA